MSSLRTGLHKLIQEAHELADELESALSDQQGGSPIHGMALKLADMLDLIEASSVGHIVDIEPN